MSFDPQQPFVAPPGPAPAVTPPDTADAPNIIQQLVASQQAQAGQAPSLLAKLQAMTQGPGDAPPTTSGAPQIKNALSPELQQQVQEQLQDTPEKMMARLRSQYFGLKDGQTDPTTGTRLKKAGVEILKLLSGMPWKPPEYRNQDIVDKFFPMESQRLGVAGAFGKTQNDLAKAQAQLDEKDKALGALTDYHKSRLAQDAQNEKDRNDARQVRNSILGLNVNSLTNERAKQGALMEAQAKLKTYQLEHPDITPGRLFSLLMQPNEDGSVMKPEDMQTMMQLFAGVHAAASPFAAAGSTSSSSMDPTTGITSTTSQKNFVNPNVIRNLRGIFGGAGGGAMSPQAPSGTPPAATSPTPGVNPANPMGNLIDMVGGQNLPGKVGKGVGGMMMAEAKKRQDSIHALESFGMKANAGVDNLIAAIGSGKAKDFQGAWQGNPLMGDMRTMFGNVTPEEAFQKLLQTDQLYSKLGANIRGRFTVPEIAGHLRNMGGLSQAPENALQSIMALKLQNDIQKLFEHGDITQKDAPLLGTLAKGEMQRIQGGLKNLTPQEKTRMLATGATPDRLHLGDMADLLKQARAAKTSGGNVNGFSLDDINKEVARRKAAKK